ncbi:MAG: hypothetical protein IKP73_21345 [Bacteroidales bacterium]|nr:hypothetical protein [Bacteroidales bacterium]
MELNQAIKKAVDKNGVEILKERHLLGHIFHANAFGSDAIKNELRRIYDAGYGNRIFDAYSAKDIDQINAVKHSIINKYGNEKVFSHIFNEFNRAFGLPIVMDENETSSDYDKIKIVNMKIVNCDGNGREIKKSTFSTKEIRYLTPKVNIVSGYDSDRTIDFTIKVTNKGKKHSYFCQANIKSGQSEDLLLQGYGNDNGVFFTPGECSFEIYLDNKILSQKGINISKPKLTAEENAKRDMIIKIVAAAIGVLLNIPTYFVSGWWLFLTILATFVCGFTLFDYKTGYAEWKKWMNYACLITLFITILTPLPWWLLIIEFYGLIYTSSNNFSIWLNSIESNKDYE